MIRLIKKIPFPFRKASTARRLVISLSVIALTGGAAGESLTPAYASAPPTLVSSTAASAITPKTLTLKIDGQSFTLPGGISKDKTTYVALRPISERLQLKLSWSQKEQGWTLLGRNTSFTVRTALTSTFQHHYTVNGQTIWGPVPSLVKGSMYVPLRFLLESFSYELNVLSSGVYTANKLPMNELTVKTKSFHELTQTSELDVQYPQIDGFKDRAVQNKVNQYLEARVKELAAQGRKELATYQGQYADENLCFIQYFIKHNQKDKLSIILESNLFQGAGYAFPTRFPITFDLKTGEVLTLQEIAGNHPSYKAIINQEIKKLFSKKYGPLSRPFESISDDPLFYLHNNTLVVFFPVLDYTTKFFDYFPEFRFPLSKFQQ